MNRIVVSSFNPKSRSFDFLLKYGEFFREKLQNDKVMYFYGGAASEKTSLVETPLNLVFNNFVGSISQYKSRFQLSTLVGKHWVILNESNIAKIGREKSLLVFEDAPLVVDIKKKPAEVINSTENKIIFIIISNSPPAFSRGIDSFYLQERPSNINRDEEICFSKKLEIEAASICVLTNSLRLLQSPLHFYNLRLPKNWDGKCWKASDGTIVTINSVGEVNISEAGERS